MLVLSRRERETIKIGEEICVTVVRCSDGTVRLGIDAPRQLVVLRGELEPFEQQPPRAA